MLALIREDYAAHGKDLSLPGFRSMVVYRFGVWRMSIKSPWLRKPMSGLYLIAYRYCRNVYGIELPYTAQLGRRVVIEHQGGIIIHGASIIGDGCIIRQNCTIGMRHMDDPHAAPVLGADIHIGAGAAILGRITIGAGARIGANAVVISDIPAGALAVGVPAQIITKRQQIDHGRVIA